MALFPLWLLLSQQQDIPESASEALDTADSIVLYSLEPQSPPSTPGKRLHHFIILGQIELNKDQFLKVISTIRAAIPRWRFGIKTSSCFNPRQAIEVTSKGQKFDFMICYECHKLAVYKGSDNLAWLEVSGDPSTLNRILAESGIPLSRTAPQAVHATSPE
jgi:hypothetical protein